MSCFRRDSLGFRVVRESWRKHPQPQGTRGAVYPVLPGQSLNLPGLCCKMGVTVTCPWEGLGPGRAGAGAATLLPPGAVPCWSRDTVRPPPPRWVRRGPSPQWACDQLSSAATQGQGTVSLGGRGGQPHSPTPQATSAASGRLRGFRGEGAVCPLAAGRPCLPGSLCVICRAQCLISKVSFPKLVLVASPGPGAVPDVWLLNGPVSSFHPR